MVPYFIGLDLGTTGARGVAIDSDGRIAARAATTYALHTPRPGWTEQNPDDWWDATVDVLRRLQAEIGDRIEGIGLTGQMHGAVFLDEEGQSIRPAILWNDQRTAGAAREIDRIVGTQLLQRIAGNAALTGFQAPKILWLRANEPANYTRLRAVLLPKDFIRFKLSGAYASDASDASGTLLLDLRARDWSPELLDALDLKREWFPPVFESPEICARTDAAAAKTTGLTQGTPIVAGAGDNAAAAIGSGAVRSGIGLISLGTSGVVLAHSDEPVIDPSGALHAFCGAVPGSYHLMGVMLAAGGSLRWFRDTLGRDESYDELTKLANEVPAGSLELFFLPYLSGERTPHMNPFARAAWIGLSLAHTRAHMLRSVLEGVAFGLNDALVRMRALGVRPQELVSTGNGMNSTLWRSILSAVFQIPLRPLLVDEGAACGAALLAAVGAGAFASVEDAVAKAVVLADSAISPDPQLEKTYAEAYETFTRLYPAIAPIAFTNT
jgi:xylulokinase